MFGIYLLTAPDAGGLNRGDLLTLICAACFGGQIVAVTALSRRYDARRLVFCQIATTALLGALAAGLAHGGGAGAGDVRHLPAHGAGRGRLEPRRPAHAHLRRVFRWPDRGGHRAVTPLRRAAPRILPDRHDRAVGRAGGRAGSRRRRWRWRCSASTCSRRRTRAA